MIPPPDARVGQASVDEVIIIIIYFLWYRPWICWTVVRGEEVLDEPLKALHHCGDQSYRQQEPPV